MAATQIAKVNHRHHAIIDWLMAHPHIKNLQVCADALNLSRSWLSIVMNSDAFQDEFRRRREALDDQLQAELIRTSFETAIRANLKLQEYMEAPADKLDPRILLDASNATADRLYGPKGGTFTKETTREFILDNGMLKAARERIREVNSVEPKALPAPSDTEHS